MPKTKDWTKFSSYKGLSCEKALETMKSCGHMLALGSDDWVIPVVRACIECEKEIGMAAIVAAMFCHKHGAGSTAMRAIAIYKDIAKKLNDRDLDVRIRNLEYMVYFAARDSYQELKWPMVWPYDDMNRMLGLANVMLGLASMRLEKDGASTSEWVAIAGIHRFMEEHKERAA